MTRYACHSFEWVITCFEGEYAKCNVFVFKWFIQTNCRPFYVSTATPTEKDVVIVIDKSNSMSATDRGKPLIQIAKEATVTVLRTLNPSDRVRFGHHYIIIYTRKRRLFSLSLVDCPSIIQIMNDIDFPCFTWTVHLLYWLGGVFSFSDSLWLSITFYTNLERLSGSLFLLFSSSIFRNVNDVRWDWS